MVKLLREIKGKFAKHSHAKTKATGEGGTKSLFGNLIGKVTKAPATARASGTKPTKTGPAQSDTHRGAVPAVPKHRKNDPHNEPKSRAKHGSTGRRKGRRGESAFIQPRN